ncbi:hypothetical protein SEA_CLUBPENGUIN_46 [Streptomyces phage ClubPenguin]|nr:hypothetical protein SEA_CLUBPENGUIN_46 [Streptomyces phage ClubPenguin]
MKLKLSILTKQAKKAVADNSPAILTALGVTGTLTVAYLTGKASFKAAEILAKETAQREVDGDPEMDTWDKVDLVWREFIPAAGIAAMTVSAIVGANHISTKRVAAFASAYSMAEKGFTQYKDKVLEKVGPKKEEEIRDEVAKQQMRDHPLHKSPIIITGKGDHLCFDAHSGRYFQSDIERVRSAVNDINFEVLNNDSASLSDYWHLVGLDSTSGSDDLGWTTDKKLECHYTSELTKEGTPCLVVTFLTQPRPLTGPIGSTYNAY